MGSFWAAALAQVRSWPRDRLFIWLLLIAPLSGMVILDGLFADGLLRRLPVAVCDLDGSSTSRELIRRVDALPSARVAALLASSDEGRDAIRRGEVFAVLVIPRHFAPSVAPPSDTSVNPLAVKASSPMLFTLPSAISDSAAQPLNALSAIDATDEGSVTSARAEHPSNVLGPTAATPDGTTALVSAVHPLKAPSAIDVVFSKRRIPPSFSLPASKAGNSAET